jgi:hypothetical protein
LVEMASPASLRSSGSSVLKLSLHSPDSVQVQAGQGGRGPIYGHLSIGHTGDVAL